MKKYYNLIGKEVALEEWIVSFEDFPPAFPQADYHQMLTASSWPVLFFEQIPQRFIYENPGFPILLRKETPRPLPQWIHQPLLANSNNISGRYIIQTHLSDSPKKILFSIAHPINKTWQELCDSHPAEEHRWVWNTDKKLIPANLNLPLDLKLGMGQIVYEQTYKPNQIVDLSFGISDTYTPIHLFGIHHDCELQLLMPFKTFNIMNSKNVNKSKWLILK